VWKIAQRAGIALSTGDAAKGANRRMTAENAAAIVAALRGDRHN
jgi:hypothetical protein